MSLVGTRPILPDELEQYELHHRARIAIKPGITGMWQVSGRSDITDFEEIVRLDTEYISEWNIFRFHRPAVKVEFTEHIGSKRRVEKIGGKVFFGTIVKDNFDNPNSNTRDYGEGVAGTVFRDLEVVFQAHKTEMPLRSTVAEEILRIIAPVKNNDTVMEDPEIFKDFEMFDSGRTFGSKIMM